MFYCINVNFEVIKIGVVMSFVRLCYVSILFLNLQTTQRNIKSWCVCVCVYIYNKFTLRKTVVLDKKITIVSHIL